MVLSIASTIVFGLIVIHYTQKTLHKLFEINKVYDFDNWNQLQNNFLLKYLCFVNVKTFLVLKIIPAVKVANCIYVCRVHCNYEIHTYLCIYFSEIKHVVETLLIVSMQGAMGFMNGRRKPNLAAQSVGTLIGEVRMERKKHLFVTRKLSNEKACQ